MADAQAKTSDRVEKVRAAAHDLVIKQGFKGVTMAAVAARAHVGKGTPYLYWRRKEDLFAELIARELAGVLATLAHDVRADPALAAADRLIPALAEEMLTRPLIRAIQLADEDVLGSLLDDPRTRAIYTEHGAGTVLRAMLPVWREHASIQSTWPESEQAAAVELVLLGFFAMHEREVRAGIERVPIAGQVISAMLDVRHLTAAAAADLAAGISSVLDERARRLLHLAI